MEFHRTDILGKELYEDPRSPYDIVACLFALHYFMVSESAIENLLLNVASNLRIGTCKLSAAFSFLQEDISFAHVQTERE